MVMMMMMMPRLYFLKCIELFGRPGEVFSFYVFLSRRHGNANYKEYHE